MTTDKRKEVESWLERNERLAKEMEAFANKFRCKKCGEYYCEHMLRVRGRIFKDRIDRELSFLAEVKK